MGQFKRTVRQSEATKDGKGQIRVSIGRTEKGTFAKGNITRSMVIEDAKVSEVFRAIETALFED